jgi:hypothetical protein
VTSHQCRNVKHAVHTVTTVFKLVNFADSSGKVFSLRRSVPRPTRDMQTARHIARGIKTNAVHMVKRHPSFERDCTSPFDLAAKSICYLEDRKVTMAPQNVDEVRSKRCSLETVRLCALRQLEHNVTSAKMDHCHTWDLLTTNHHCSCYGFKNWYVKLRVKNISRITIELRRSQGLF